LQYFLTSDFSFCSFECEKCDLESNRSVFNLLEKKDEERKKKYHKKKKEKQKVWLHFAQNGFNQTPSSSIQQPPPQRVPLFGQGIF